MQVKIAWAMAALAWYGALALAHRVALGATGGTGLPGWGYALGFFVLGVLLLGAVARLWRKGSPALWRPLMLSVGSMAAAVEVALLPVAPGQHPVDLWMTALLGLVAAALLARLLPDRLNRAWLGIDRRAHDIGA